VSYPPIEQRISYLVSRELISQESATQFLKLEALFSTGNMKGIDWLEFYHLSNDEYVKLLEKVLKALCSIGEPWANEKLRYFNGELGLMSPGVYNTPWEITLDFLDKEVP